MTRSESAAREGQEMYDLIRDLYPICRSITGDGVRKTLAVLRKYIPLEVHEVPSGTKVFDWTVPREWNIRDGYVRDSTGSKIIDFSASNLHVVNYSVPVHATVSLSELKDHLFSIPEKPDVIPYRTSYYKEDWGFCVRHDVFQSLSGSEYEVVIDSTLKDGHLTYGEYALLGETDEEILLSCHICHPSLCNDNLSGIALSAFLARSLESVRHRYTYRFLFIPGTIGAITWLALNEAATVRIKHGLVVACVGDGGGFTYKKSRQGKAEIDRVVEYLLRASDRPYRVREFTPYGYDERQYCSPGFNLAVGSLTRTPHGEFPEYHTSADNLSFVRPEHLAGSLTMYRSVMEMLEANRRYLNLNPKCEPQLGRRGLYRHAGGYGGGAEREMALLWVLNLSDGTMTILDIAERSGLTFQAVRAAAEDLLEHGLLRPLGADQNQVQ